MIHTIDLHFLGAEHTIASYLLDAGDGLTLVETGPYSTYERLEEGITGKGYQVEEIKHVLLTHIHLDHAGAAWALAEKGATIYVHPFGAKHLLDPSRLIGSAKRIYQEKMDELWGAMHPISEDRINAVEHGEMVITGNLNWKAWHTPGHASHHIAWQLDNVIFTGDVAGVRIDGGIVVPPCPPPDINIEDWQESIQLLRAQRPTDMYLTHYGKVSDVDDHLDQLEKRLLEWAGWMRPYFERGAGVEEVTPVFQEYVKQELEESGVKGEQLLQYEYANPSWMSVAGLLRYWRKKQGEKMQGS